MKDNQHFYLFSSNQLIKRSDSVRYHKELSILEFKICSLVFISSFGHINIQAYENSKMHDDPIYKNQITIDELIYLTAKDDQRRYEQLKNLLHNKRLLDFGCGVGGFMLKAR